jgi:hypothetical protein
MKSFMKKTILALSILTSLYSTVAGATSLQEFAGAYEINTSLMGIVFQGNFDVEADGKIKILASSFYLSLNCVGTAELVNDVLISTPVCENGMALNLKINLAHISDFSKFQAPVYNSILSTEIPIEFKRL